MATNQTTAPTTMNIVQMSMNLPTNNNDEDGLLIISDHDFIHQQLDQSTTSNTMINMNNNHNHSTITAIEHNYNNASSITLTNNPKITNDPSDNLNIIHNNNNNNNNNESSSATKNINNNNNNNDHQAQDDSDRLKNGDDTHKYNNDIGDISNSDPQQDNDEDDSVDITISNVVTHFSVKCHLNLKQIATNGSNVVYRREQSIIRMKLRKPHVTANIWSSGKITCTGATTEESARCASRKVARCLQKLGFRVKFSNYKVVNVMGACKLPFGIKIHEFSKEHRPLASYEPELHPGATYRIKELKAVLKIFQTGSITITAPSIQNVQLAVENVYPLVYEFRKPKPLNMNNNNESKKYPYSNCEGDGLDIEMDDDY